MINFLNNIISSFVDFLVSKPFIQKKLKGKNVDEIVNLYSKVEYTKNFVKFRFWFGPLHEVNKLVPKSGTILDLGCGEGILTNFLALSSKKRKMIGIEINADRVQQAKKRLKNTKFLTGSALEMKLPKADTIVVSHVFHHLGSKERQIDLIKNISKNLKPSGKLVVAEVDRQFSLRYLFGYIVDVLLVPIFFEKKLLDLKIYHRGKKEWTKILKNNGLKIIYSKNTEDRIYPEILFVAVKK